jgi:hypothetical protein
MLYAILVVASVLMSNSVQMGSYQSSNFATMGNGAEICLKSNSPTVSAGSSIRLHVLLTNRSADTMQFDLESDFRTFGLEIRDSSGKIVQPAFTPDEGFGGSIRQRDLSSQQSHDFSGSSGTPINKWGYVLSSAGTFEFRVFYLDAKRSKHYSNTVSIRVSD